MRWGRKTIAGKDYDLSHLDDFKLEVRPKAEGARSYEIRVSFGFHTFTRDLKDEDKPDLYMRHENELRCFCFDRYKYSLKLQEAIRYAAAGRVYFSENRNFLIVESLPDDNAPYVVVFNVQKTKKEDRYDAAMFVTSAYPKPGLPDRLPAVTFATLVDYTVQGKLLKRPEPRRIVVVKRK